MRVLAAPSCITLATIVSLLATIVSLLHWLQEGSTWCVCVYDLQCAVFFKMTQSGVCWKSASTHKRRNAT